MNFLNLQYFCVAAEELSFTKAAKRLFISQQSLSSHISRLEEEFGVTLFNRTQPVTLTEAGECLYRNSRVLLYQKNETEKALQDIRDFRSGELTIGASTSRGAIMLADILPEFHRRFPQIQLHLVEGTTKQINKALYEGRADVNIGFAINDPENVHEELLHIEHLTCMVPLSFLASCAAEGTDPPRPGTMQSFKIFSNRRMVFWERRDWRDTVAVYPLDYPSGNQPITISHLRNHYISRAATEFIHMAKQKFTY